jgi:hypothetical protein
MEPSYCASHRTEYVPAERLREVVQGVLNRIVAKEVAEVARVGKIPHE